MSLSLLSLEEMLLKSSMNSQLIEFSLPSLQAMSTQVNSLRLKLDSPPETRLKLLRSTEKLLLISPLSLRHLRRSSQLPLMLRLNSTQESTIPRMPLPNLRLPSITLRQTVRLLTRLQLNHHQLMLQQLQKVKVKIRMKVEKKALLKQKLQLIQALKEPHQPWTQSKTHINTMVLMNKRDGLSSELLSLLKLLPSHFSEICLELTL